ncbi:response regulator [Streptomyces sp. NPDC055722]
MTIRVLVVDDQPLIRDALAALLATAGDVDVVGTASDGAGAVRQAGRCEPDVVLMDIRMPGMDGVEATRHLRSLPRPPAVVMLTTFDLDEYVLAAVRAGASGFLLKDGDADDLVAGIRTAAAGDAILAPRAVQRLVDHIAGTRAHDPAAVQAVSQLTAREREVLAQLAKGLTNAEIAGALSVSEATAKTHVSNVLAKLHARDRTQAVVIAYTSGLA